MNYKETFVIKRKTTGKYAFKNTKSGDYEYMGNATDNHISNVVFGNGTDYYKKAYNLWKAADSYGSTGVASATVDSNSLSTLQNAEPDYNSDSSYVIIGTLHLAHPSNVTVDSSVVSATDNNGKDIKDSIVLTTKKTKNTFEIVNGTDVTIKVKKSNLPTSIKNINLKYSVPNVVTNARFYILKYSGGQTLITGEGTLGNYNGYVDIELDKKLIPPAKITLTKASSKGGNLSGAEFNVVATQGSETLKSDTITTTDGKAVFECQPTSKDTNVVITITEKIAPNGSGGIYKKLNSAMVITLTYDTSSNKWKATETTDTEEVLEITNATNIDIKVTNQFIAKIDLNLTKASSLGGNLSGATFKVEASQVGGEVTTNSSTITTNSAGKATFTCQPTTEADVTIKITEITKPTDTVGKYEKLNETMEITLKYNTVTHKWTATEKTDEENVLNIDNATNTDITIKNQYISPIKIGGDIDGFGGFNKVDQAGDAVVGAEFKAVFTQNGTTIATKTATSNESGKLDFEAVKPDTTSNVTVRITETKAPAGYENSNYDKTIEFAYDKNEHTWNQLTNDVNAQVKYYSKTTYVDINDVENKSQIDKLTLIKQDSQDSSNLEGAKFNITLENVISANIKGSPKKTADEEGKIVYQNVSTTSEGLILENIVIKDLINNPTDRIRVPVIITIEETLAPKGYKKIDGKITIKITRTKTEYTITTENSEGVTESEFAASATVLIDTKGDITGNGKLDVNDALMALYIAVGLDDDYIVHPDRADVNGDEIVNSEDALWILQHKTVSITVDDNIIKAIEVENKGDVDGDGSVTAMDALLVLEYAVDREDERIKYPQNGDINGDGKVNSQDALVLLRYLVRDIDTNSAETGVTENNHKIEVKMNDIPIMNLGGIVWAEKEKSGKNPTQSDVYGDGNEEEALGGITVRLKKNGTVVATMETATKDGGKTVKYLNNKGEEKTVSLNKGQYLFTDLEVGEDYTVEFDYDGIKYNTLKNTASEILYSTNKKSKISDENDKGLANGTKTVSGSNEQDKSNTNGGFIIEYNLENEPYQSAIYDKTTKDGEQVYVTATTSKYLQQKNHWLDSWKETSEAGVYEIDLRHYAFDVNCGLYEKYFDLNLGTDVDTATVSINGKQATYTYDQILDGKMDQDLNKTTYGQVTYNQYLSKSDYRYRISDYNTERNQKPTEPDTDTDTVIDDIKGNELNITVNYRLLLNNQSRHTAYVNEIEYIYDDAYEYKGANRTDITVETVGNNKLKITQNGTSLELGNGAQQEIILTFEIRKNGDGTFVKDPANEEEYVNKAEIISYSTAEGRLIDADSAPGNAFLSGYEERYEDDTDKAAGIKVVFKTDDRIISGTVFDDDSDKPVDDVIVQLIEVKKLTNARGEEKLYEYIWQETLSGSNKVYKTNVNGWVDDYFYTNDVESGSGNYEFKDFIPGKYIVRFIYGDGRVYNLTENTLKYNGEDYKSTYNSSYDKEWYNADEYLLNNNDEYASKAVDNEARRLKVMSYAVDVDATKGAELKKLDESLVPGADNTELKQVLNNTWMAAETAKINVSVDSDDYIDETTEKEVKGNSVIADSTIGKGKNSGEPKFANTQFTNVNFGLMERPKTKLVLEKHITGLTIKPVESGVRLIADARADIENILNNVTEGQITLEGEQTGLLAIKSTRSNRGYWYLQTDTTELAQGADAYITYTYVITNKGDEDYLSADLVTAYCNNSKTIGKTTYTYEEYLKYLENTVKKQIKLGSFTKGTYLSNFYYTGDSAGATEVLASVESMQEDLNPKVTYVDGDNMTKSNVASDKPYYNSNGSLITDTNIGEIGKIKETITSGSTNKLKIIKANPSTGKLVYNTDNTDWSKKAVVSKALSASEIETGGVYDSYLAEITHYTNAAGRRDQSTPANLSYVHSEDKNMNMESYKDSNGNMITAETTITVAESTITEETNYYLYGATVDAEGVEVNSSDIKLEKDKLTYVGRAFTDLNNATFEKLNENDEFWAETFRITKPTGEDKLTPVQIAIITISAVAVLGVGIILIKKFVLKK